MPLYQAVLLLATIISGGLFYDEFGEWSASVSATYVAGFAVGVAMLIGGIVLVTLSKGANEGDRHPEERAISITKDTDGHGFGGDGAPGTLSERLL